MRFLILINKSSESLDWPLGLFRMFQQKHQVFHKYKTCIGGNRPARVVHELTWLAAGAYRATLSSPLVLNYQSQLFSVRVLRRSATVLYIVFHPQVSPRGSPVGQPEETQQHNAEKKLEGAARSGDASITSWSPADISSPGGTTWDWLTKSERSWAAAPPLGPPLSSSLGLPLSPPLGPVPPCQRLKLPALITATIRARCALTQPITVTSQQTVRQTSTLCQRAFLLISYQPVSDVT